MENPETFDAAAFQRETNATDVQIDMLEQYRALLEDWSRRMNLVGPSAMAQFWRRHAYDSAQLLPVSKEARVWADVGAGAGFPGVVLAILLKGRDGARVHLIESMIKRCNFLRAVVDQLALPAVIHNTRAESTRLSGIEVVTARACAPMDKLLGYAAPLMKTGARGLFLKGESAEAEIAAARLAWSFEAETIPSISDSSGRIVSVRRLVRV